MDCVVLVQLQLALWNSGPSAQRHLISQKFNMLCVSTAVSHQVDKLQLKGVSMAGPMISCDIQSYFYADSDNKLVQAVQELFNQDLR